jgi:hypothetical protein
LPFASKTYVPGGTSGRILGSDPVSSRSRPSAAARAMWENSMLDLMMLALGLIFFAAAVGYTYACERL